MAFIVFHNQLSFQPVDPQGVPTGPEEIVMKGGEVPEYVPPYIINALSNAGMIVDAGDRDAAAVRAMVGADFGVREGRALPNPEQPVGAGGEPPLFTLSGDPADHEYPQVTTAEAQGRPFLTSDEGSTVRDSGSRLEGAEGEPPGSAPAEPSGQDQPEGQDEPAKPSTRDPKAAWEDYAEARGMDRGEAESLTKQELITAVESREAESA
jgi:hypothetical protein